MDPFLVELQRARSAEEIEALYLKRGRKISCLDACAIKKLVEEIELLALTQPDQDALMGGLLASRKLKQILENTGLL